MYKQFQTSRVLAKFLKYGLYSLAFVVVVTSFATYYQGTRDASPSNSLNSPPSSPLAPPAGPTAALGAPPIQEQQVVEFNATDDLPGNKEILYQYGYSEVGAYYQVSPDSQDYAGTGFRFNLPADYYEYWNLSYVNYYNLTEIINPALNEYYVSSPVDTLSYALSAASTTANDSVVNEVSTHFTNISKIQLHFSAVTLNAHDNLTVYNSSFDVTSEPLYVTTTGWTPWINTSSAVVVLNSSTTALSSFTVDSIRYWGVSFNHTGTEALVYQVDPDVISFRVGLAALKLPDESRFILSDPMGENLTEFWRYDSLGGADPQNNWSDYFETDGDAIGGEWVSDWIMPDYVVLDMDSATPAGCNFTISKFEYKTPAGWRRFYVPDDTSGLITYTPFQQQVQVNYLPMFTGNLDMAYSSWTFIFIKRPFEVSLDVYEDPTGTNTLLQEPIVLQSGKSYNLSFQFTYDGHSVDYYNFDGDPANPVRLDVWQEKALLIDPMLTTVMNGYANFTLPSDWGVANHVIAGDIRTLVQINGTNYCALDNATAARVSYWFVYKEHPSLAFNKITAEYPHREWVTPAVTMTAGTVFDPNELTFNVSALNIHGESGFLNGQPFNVTVEWEGHWEREATTYQNYHPADNHNYTLFSHSFDKIGAWTVTFVLENTTLGTPMGYFFPCASLTIDVTVVEREYNIDIYNGTEGLQAGFASEVFINLTDTEEVDLYGNHYPLENWRVDLYFLRYIGMQWRRYFIHSTTTNATGIAKVNWLPPADLAGEQIYLYAESYTPTYRLLQFEPESFLLKKGFDIEKLNTTVEVHLTKDFYYFDDPLEFNVTLADELGNDLLEEEVQVELTVGGTHFNNYTFEIGVNNTFLIQDFTPYVGDAIIEVSYAGSSAFLASQSATPFTYNKSPSYLDVDVNPAGYNYGDAETIPIKIQALDSRNQSRFYDGGVVTTRIYDENKTLMDSWTEVLTPAALSNFTIPDWNVTQNGMYAINVTYGGGTYHLSSENNLSVVVERAPVSIVMRPIYPVAGQDLVLEADVTYASNGSVIPNLSLVVEFTDQMANTYILGFNNTDAAGHFRYVYPYNPNDYYYRYMIVFGGELSLTSQMDLQLASGFAHQVDFEIEKCPTSVNLAVSPGVDPDQVSIQVYLNTSGYASPVGEELEVEVWAVDGTGSQKRVVTLPAQQVSFDQTLVYQGDHFVRVVYKGSQIFEPSVNMLRFNRTSTVSRTGGTPAGAQIGVQPSPGNSLFIFYLQFVCLLVPLLIYARCTWTLKGKKSKLIMGLALLAVFATSSVYVISVTSSSVPYEEERVGTFDVGAASNFSWLRNENLPEEDFNRLAAQLNLDTSVPARPQLATENMTAEELDSLRQVNQFFVEEGLIPAAPDANTPRGAQYSAEDSIRYESIGYLGNTPYPIGDTLNITFTTVKDSFYVIVVTDIQLHRRIRSIYGHSAENQDQQVYINIDEGTFYVGGQFALELYVYEKGVTNYLSRDTRRMVFTVVRGFAKMEIEFPDVELYQDRQYTLVLTEELSGRPLANQDVTIYIYNETLGDYQFHQLATTDATGRVTLPLPRNEPKGDFPIRVIYNGNQAHYSVANSTSYEVSPLTTYISLAASPAYYTDPAQMTGLLYDQYGNKLVNKTLEFLVHLVNTTVGDRELVEVEDEWYSLGNASTNAEGVATLAYQANFPEGKYEVAALYEGSQIYAEARTQGRILEIYKERLNVEFLETDLIYGHTGIISANLTDDDGPGGTKGNGSAYTPVSFDAYVDHQWVHLNSTNTTGSGTAIVQYSPHFDEGTYVLRLTKEEDARYATDVTYGNLTIRQSNTRLDVGLNSTEYLDEITLSAQLHVENNTEFVPVIGESLLFYVEQQMPDGSTQYNYIGYGVTDGDGLAKCVWTARDRPPGHYTLKVLFPGNEYAEQIVAYKTGLKITKGILKIQLKAPTQVCVMDYADFRFNLTNKLGQLVWGETLNLKIYNTSDATDLLLERDIVTDVEGNAYFRWCPAHPGNFTFEANVVSEYYTAPVLQTLVVVKRKSINFNCTYSPGPFYRGDLFQLDGNTSIVYKYYNGTTERLPATAVPLRFYIWNESAFTHPVSGYQVPNVPLKNTDDEFLAYSGTGDEAGQFDWEFLMPDEFYGLQAGRYFLKIRVDQTKTGLYEGECLISFDLKEPTTMDVWVEQSENVTKAQAKAHPWSREALPASHKYFVEERETVYIQIQDQDGADGSVVHPDGHRGLMRYNYQKPTYRDLIIRMGADTTLYFHLDVFDRPSIYYFNDSAYNSTTGTWDLTMLRNITSVESLSPLDFLVEPLEPEYDPTTGIYSFKYRPYFQGNTFVGVIFAGDRFFDAVTHTLLRKVYGRPTYLDTYVSHTKDLYRKGTPDSTSQPKYQKSTRFEATLTDTLNGTPTDGKIIEFYFNHRLMHIPNGHNMSQMINMTGSLGDGKCGGVWEVDNWIQAGNYPLRIKSPLTRVYASRSETHTLEIWETTTTSIYSITGGFHGQKIWLRFYDQDGTPISDAKYSIQITAKTPWQYTGGRGRISERGVLSHGDGAHFWVPAWSVFQRAFYSDPLQICVDFVGDVNQNFRPSSVVRWAINYGSVYWYGQRRTASFLWWSWSWNTVDWHTDRVLYFAPEGSPSRAANPFLAYDPIDEGEAIVYWNIQEARRFYALEDAGMVSVNTLDGYGYVDAKEAYYVWQLPSEDLHYYPAFQSHIPAIIAFANKENAEIYARDNQQYRARLVPWEMVWSLPEEDKRIFHLWSNFWVETTIELDSITGYDAGTTGDGMTPSMASAPRSSPDVLPPGLPTNEEMEAALGDPMAGRPTLSSYLGGASVNQAAPASQSSQELRTATSLMQEINNPNGFFGQLVHVLDYFGGGAQFYREVAQIAGENGARGIYMFVFELMEYLTTNGMVWRPGISYPSYGSHGTSVSYGSSGQEGFEDVSMPVTTEVAQPLLPGAADPGQLVPSYDSVTKRRGQYSLKVTRTGGDKTQSTDTDRIYFPVEQHKYRARANAIQFYLRYSNATVSQDSANQGITVRFYDTDNRWLAYKIPGSSLPSYNRWHLVTIPMSELYGIPMDGDVTGAVSGGQMDWGKLNRISLELEDGGLLSKAGSTLWIDEILFMRNEFTVSPISSVYWWTGRWERIDPTTWFTAAFARNLLAQPLYVATRYAIDHVPEYAALRNVVTWDAFKATIDHELGGLEGKAPMDVFTDLMEIVYEILHGIQRPSTYEPYLEVILGSQERGLLSRYRAMSAAQRAQVSGIDPDEADRVFRFILAGSLEGFCNNVPRYWYDLDDTWNAFKVNGYTNVKHWVEQGFSAISQNAEEKYFFTTITVGAVSHRTRDYRIRFVRQIGNAIVHDAFSALQDKFDYSAHRGRGGSAHDELQRFSLHGFIDAAGDPVIDALYDLIADELVDQIDLPWWLSWLFSSSKRRLFNWVVDLVFEPMEDNLWLVKVVGAMTMGLVLADVVVPFITDIFQTGVNSFLHPLALIPTGHGGAPAL